jgi:2-polyprenyl-3-methyl-5-hydroxy-6-metoxy-1,4-benzoquinol methylase
MHYDPIKDIFASIINKSPSLRVLFYKILDIMFLRSWYVRSELKNLRKLFNQREISIYDAGTGFGQYTYFAAKKLKPNTVHAVDIKQAWINDCKNFFAAKNLKNVTFAIEDLTNINHNSRFDLIICVDVMEHIQEDVKVFQNFYKALKPGGFLLINTPSTFGGSDVHEKSEESFIGEHARAGYSKEDLSERLIPIGFNIFKWKYTYGLWGDIAWRIGIKYPMILLNLSKLFFVILPVYYLIASPMMLLFMFIDFMKENKIGSGINLVAKK